MSPTTVEVPGVELERPFERHYRGSDGSSEVNVAFW